MRGRILKFENVKMRNQILIVACFVFCFCTNPEQGAEHDRGSDKYVKSDLKKLKWIEGKWKGLSNNQPFYEIYQIVNDSTLQITSFDWNGKDSSNTSRSFVYWKDTAYYLGEQMNWKVTGISEVEIRMKKNFKASNDIIWRFSDASSWDAELESAKGVVKYHMERFDPWGKAK